MLVAIKLVCWELFFGWCAGFGFLGFRILLVWLGGPLEGFADGPLTGFRFVFFM